MDYTGAGKIRIENEKEKPSEDADLGSCEWDYSEAAGREV